MFVLGDYSHVVRRPSLPNFPLPSETDEAPSVIMFNSQRFGDILGDPDEYVVRVVAAVPDVSYEVPHPSTERIAAISAALRDITGLSLFGYDLITATTTKQYLQVR